MAIDTELLQILVCPENRTPLTEASEEVIARLNAAIEACTLKNREGKVVDEKVDGGLIRQDGQFLYPVREEIPIMLIEEGIPLAQI